MRRGSNEQVCKSNLAHALRVAIKKKYTRISAAALSDEFNLRALGASTISAETMRKWRSGSVMPSASHLVVLRDWLGLDLNTLFSRVEHKAVRDQNPDRPVNEKPLSPIDALERLDETIRVLLDTRRTISSEMRKIEKQAEAIRKKRP
jgi:transcriptional regulator with XRE-family HTH domain